MVPVSVRVGRLPQVPAGSGADVVLAITEGPLVSQVARGENSGRTLRHVAVTRAWLDLGRLEPGQAAFQSQTEVRIEREWKSEHLKAVVFVQEQGTGRILGAASNRLKLSP